MVKVHAPEGLYFLQFPVFTSDDSVETMKALKADCKYVEEPT